jgi:hypothetical protein
MLHQAEYSDSSIPEDISARLRAQARKRRKKDSPQLSSIERLHRCHSGIINPPRNCSAGNSVSVKLYQSRQPLPKSWVVEGLLEHGEPKMCSNTQRAKRRFVATALTPMLLCAFIYSPAVYAQATTEPSSDLASSETQTKDGGKSSNRNDYDMLK